MKSNDATTEPSRFCDKCDTFFDRIKFPHDCPSCGGILTETNPTPTEAANVEPTIYYPLRLVREKDGSLKWEEGPPNVEQVDLELEQAICEARNCAVNEFQNTSPSQKYDYEIIDGLIRKIKSALQQVATSRDGEHEAAIDREQARWQEAIYEELGNAVTSNNLGIDIDGAGCDSGDPLDFTLTEICQVNNAFSNRLTDANSEIARLKLELSAKGETIK